MERTKEGMLKEMKKLNTENNLNPDIKALSTTLFENAIKIGNKIFLCIPTSLMKIDHDMYQRALQRHVRMIAKNWNDDKCDPLMVNYRNDGYFYVIDGQHRLEAALMRNIERLVCVVFVGMSIKEEADIFTEQNEGTKKLSPYDTYKANICRGEEIDTKIDTVCKRYGIKVVKSSSIKTLRSVTAARKIVKNSGAATLDWIFYIFKKSGWDNFKESYSSCIMMGLYNIRMIYSKNIPKIENIIINFFKTSSPKEITALGNAEYPQYGPVVRINKILVEIIKSDNLTESNAREKFHVVL